MNSWVRAQSLAPGGIPRAGRGQICGGQACDGQADLRHDLFLDVGPRTCNDRA